MLRSTLVRPLRSLVGLACLLAVAVSACDDGSPPARGFGSRQLIARRDRSFSFVSQSTPDTLIVSNRSADQTLNYWSIDLAGGGVEDLGPTVPGNGYLPPSQTAPLSCSITWSGLVGTVTVTDARTGEERSFEIAAQQAWPCPTATDPNVWFWRRSADGAFELWAGDYHEPELVPLPVVVREVISSGPSQIVVLAGEPARPDAFGMYSIDVVSRSVETMVPATLGTARWADGATAAGELASDGLASTTSWGQTLNGIGMSPHLYVRRMADGGLVMFAGPFTDGDASELALFRVEGQQAEIFVGEATAGVAIGIGTMPSRYRAWQHGGGGAAGEDLVLAWQPDLRRVVSCALPPSQVRLRALSSQNAGQILVRVDNGALEGELSERGPLLLISTGPGDLTQACRVVAERDVGISALSDDGQTLVWLSAPFGQPRVLWAAASDGSSAREIGAGEISSVAFVVQTQVQLVLDDDLVWVDVRDDPVRMHYVAERIFGYPTPITVDWSLTGYDYSSQDVNGTLGIVNRRTGEKRRISPAVSSYFGGWASTTARPDARPVFYVVYGRNPSDQDGLWMASVGIDDLR